MSTTTVTASSMTGSRALEAAPSARRSLFNASPRLFDERLRDGDAHLVGETGPDNGNSTHNCVASEYIRIACTR